MICFKVCMSKNSDKIDSFQKVIVIYFIIIIIIIIINEND